ncbi:hypothetical protein Poli38472_005116 [Pythium oligandrum]|uniref:protein-tyrosine-phosphatase n=1 Tax=Pythium oligandrum TaxID=41045 RepID=A0A8K1CHC5_PYTOL|nr:hypothetical protein Poli38472_005116 [Pythium oligandrum]|eukprot:TMW62498.1 hypothetical protein Poli38472_005116 [Pythium oligandrum]
MPAAWDRLADEEELDASTVDELSHKDEELHDDDTTSSSTNSQRSGQRHSFQKPLRLRLLKRARVPRPSVPSISPTSLYNRLQTASVVVVDCRSAEDFDKSHLYNALHCAPLRRRGAAKPKHKKKKTVEDVLAAYAPESDVVRKLANRDMMEIVVIGSNRTSSPLLYRMDWGYRFARKLLTEGRVYSVVFLSSGFADFTSKYPFLLRGTQYPDAPVRSADPQRKLSDAPPQYPNEIINDFLFLGNFWQANDERTVRDLRITHVVNVGAITENRNKFDHIKYLDVDIKDNVDVNIGDLFAPTVAFIQRALREHGRVLIHCVQGISRSSTIVIWYVMIHTRCSLSAAYSYVLKRRPLIFPNRGFMTQLMENEKALYGSESVLPEDVDLLQNGLLAPLDRKGSNLRLSFVNKS